MSRSLFDDVQRSGARIARNAHVLLRLERLMARRRLAVARNRAVLLALACMVGGVAFFMANVAVFFWLAASLGNAMTGAVLAGVNLVVAAILVLIGWRISSERELEPVSQMRDMLLTEIEAELTDGLTEARRMTETVQRMASDPLGALAPGLIGPALALLLKKKKSE